MFHGSLGNEVNHSGGLLYRDTSLIENAFPEDPTVGLCPGPFGGPRRGGAFSYERGTPVGLVLGVEYAWPLSGSC